MKTHLLFLFLIGQILFCQVDNNVKFSDSISNFSIRSLDKLTINYESSKDTLRASITAKKLIANAKKENNFEFVSRGFHTLHNLQRDNRSKEILVDSMLFFARLSEKAYLLTDAYYLGSNAAYYKGDYKSAMELLAEAYRYAILNGDEEDAYLMETNMASIKNVLERYYEANQIYKNAFKKYSTSEYLELENKEEYLDLVYNLTISFANLKQFDSTLAYAKRGKELATISKLDTYVNAFERSNGLAYLGIGDTDKALLYLNKSLVDLSVRDLSHSYFYIGLAHEGKNDSNKALSYYKKADSLIAESGLAPYQDLKWAQKFIYENLNERGESETANIYLRKYFELDSSLTVTRYAVGERMHELYNLRRIKYENQKIIKNKRRDEFFWLAFLSCFIVLLILFFVQRKKLKHQQIALKRLMSDDGANKSFEEAAISLSGIYEVNEEMKTHLVELLVQFEETKGYLDSTITLASLSKQLNTNSSYLSSVINKYKKMNFASYLKYLRINNAVNMLKNENVYSKYSMNGLSQEFGFNNADSFSKAFKEVTKINPSVFIKELKKSS